MDELYVSIFTTITALPIEICKLICEYCEEGSYQIAAISEDLCSYCRNILLDGGIPQQWWMDRAKLADTLRLPSECGSCRRCQPCAICRTQCSTCGLSLCVDCTWYRRDHDIPYHPSYCSECVIVSRAKQFGYCDGDHWPDDYYQCGGRVMEPTEVVRKDQVDEILRKYDNTLAEVLDALQQA